MTVNNKEEHSKDYCPNYVQEFGLWTYSKYFTDAAKQNFLKKVCMLLSFFSDGISILNKLSKNECL